jgi:hypothetical protein
MTTPAINTVALYAQIKSALGTASSLTVEGLVTALPQLIVPMQQFGVINSLSGFQKQTILIQLLDQFITASGSPSTAALQTLVNDLLPVVISAIVTAFESQAFQKIEASLEAKCTTCFSSSKYTFTV